MMPMCMIFMKAVKIFSIEQVLIDQLQLNQHYKTSSQLVITLFDSSQLYNCNKSIFKTESNKIIFKSYKATQMHKLHRMFFLSLQLIFLFAYTLVNSCQMPFICRPLDRFSQQSPPIQHVKHQQPSQGIQESDMLEVGQKDRRGNVQGNEGRWDQDENFKFVIFVHYYQQIFSSSHKRKACKIFKTFSQYLTNRTPAQCRSHYQKMIIKHKTIPKLKKQYKLAFGDNRYNEQFEKFKSSWTNTHPQNIISQSNKEFKQVSIQTEFTQNQINCHQCSIQKTEDNGTLAHNTNYNTSMFLGELNQFPSSLYMNFIYWMPLQNDSFIQP